MTVDGVIKLYHRTASRSARIMWLLEELELPYEVVTVPNVAAQKTEEFKQIHPVAQIPAIEVDGITVWESGACLQFILERFGGGRLEPAKDSPLRGEYLKWLWFSEATLNVPMIDIFTHTKENPVLPKEKQVPEIKALALERSLQRLSVLEKALEGKQYLLGDELTAADIFMGYSMNMAINPARAGVVTPDSTEFPNIVAYFGRLSERPGFKKGFGLGATYASK